MKVSSSNFKLKNELHERNKKTEEVKKKDKIENLKEARRLKKLVDSDETIDIKKIEEIKNKIKLGEYKINSKEIAKKMLRK